MDQLRLMSETSIENILATANKEQPKVMVVDSIQTVYSEGLSSAPGGVSQVTGKVPLSEMFQYSTMLRSITQGRGTYSMEPGTYEPVPPNIATKVLEESAKD